jgi:hypothetical protein
MGADVIPVGTAQGTEGGSGGMNGAESLVRTLVTGGVDLCFANPGTSEMHFVSALDRVDGMRSVLFLYEGGAQGTAKLRLEAEPPGCPFGRGPHGQQNNREDRDHLAP